MTPSHLLLGAAAAAVALTAVVAVGSMRGPASCPEANAAVDAANRLHQDALRSLDRADIRRRHDGDASAMGPAQLRVDAAKRELDAARAEAAALCP